MNEVIPLQECQQPEVIICQIEGIQAQAKALDDNPKEVYEIGRKRGEDGEPNPTDIYKPSLNDQIKELSNVAGYDVGTNIRKIGELSTLANSANSLATEVKAIANRADVNASQALSNIAETNTQLETVSREASDAFEIAEKAVEASKVATTQTVGTVKPFTNHFSIDETGELQINRQIFQYIQGLFNDCLKSVKQDLTPTQKQQVMQNLGAQGMLISLVRKDIAETLQGGEEKQITVRFYRRAPSLDKIGVMITSRSEWREGDISRVSCAYNGFTTEFVTIVIKNYGTQPATVRYSVQATYEL